MSKRKIRVFLGAQEIAGMMERLNNAFHDMGIKSDFWCLAKYKFSDEQDVPWIIKRFFYHSEKRSQSTTVREKKHWDKLQLIDIIIIFVYAIVNYDYFIYIFGHGLFFYNWYLRKKPELEYKILKFFNKKMIMWFCGSDSRAPYCDVDVYNGDYNAMLDKTKERSKNVKMIERYMEIIDFAASSHFHTKPYIVYNRICVPIDDKELVNNNDTENKNEKIVILHAPSNIKAKGTDRIRKTMDELRSEGYEFEYIEVTGVSHQEVLRMLKKADVVIDQLYADFPLAGFATESSANGIPVITCGYYARQYKQVAQNPPVPTVYCDPSEFKAKLIELIGNADLRKRISAEEKKFIKDNSVSLLVARKFLDIFEGRIPDEWYFDPFENEYVFGCGIEKEKIIQNVNYLVKHYGKDALCINDKPRLLQEYMDIVNGKHDNLAEM